MKYLLYIIIFTLLQALFFGRIHLFDVATPLVYTWMVLHMHRGMNKVLSMVLSFILGLSVDAFSNTPGQASTTMTLIACLQPYVLELFLRREDAPNFQPTLRALGFTRYFAYALILLAIYCIIYYMLSFLSGTMDWQEWLITTGASLLLTLAIILVIEFSIKDNS